MGEPHDRDAHLAMMRQIHESMPDRRITIHRSWTAEGAEFIEYTWRGTSPAGEVIEHDDFGVLEFDSDGHAARQRHFGMPDRSPTEPGRTR